MSGDARPAAEQPREWAPEIEEIEHRRAVAEQLGGPEAIARQHSLGKLTVRERIAALVDDGSFREFGILTGKVSYAADGGRQSFVPSNAVVGVGRIDSRKVCISADDFTIRGGSSESTNSDKWIYIERFALETKTPLVRLVDTAGGSVKLLDQQQATKIPGYNTWPVVPLLDTVPVVGVALGSCAGLGAFKVMASHF
jgi:acetyl-CoA carboxylase carboxyltransferase component